MSLDFGKSSTLALAAASMLFAAACSSGSGTGVTPSAVQPFSMTPFPFAKSSKNLLYISDSGTNEVETFAWPKPTTGSALNGSFSEPQGECADQSGNVFIANTGEENVFEYAGTTLTNTLSDPGQYPVGCSYDPSTGNLAASNIVSTSNGPGSIAIYKKAGGSPKLITSSAVQRMYFIAYDGSGNLFITGASAASQPVLAEMTKGSDTIKRICPNLFGSITFPGGIAWDGKYIVIGDNGFERIKNCKPIKPRTIVVGSSDIVDFTIVGHRLIAPDAGNADVEIYDYPKGGKPVQTLTGFSEPIGAAVSQTVKGP